ncbi:uncharacterized protein G2W53_029345 [Senna tora]|uniref:Uncharacterized protein n=1 Tax=Senna tora TaxID=362788 RepID=A0A834WDM8_9FABA|nr:uncharacterized protein G2W53_029345 [Senna tora]
MFLFERFRRYAPPPITAEIGENSKRLRARMWEHGRRKVPLKDILDQEDAFTQRPYIKWRDGYESQEFFYKDLSLNTPSNTTHKEGFHDFWKLCLNPGDVHKAIGDGEGSKNIRAVHRVKEKEQGNMPTFKRTLRIFVEDGGKRRVQWELERQATEEPPKKGVPLTTVEQISTQVKQDGRLLCWVPRAQSQVHQGSSVQETNVMKRDVGVQTEEYEIVVLGDVRGVELAGMGEKGTKVGEGVSRSAPCKGKAKMDAQDNTIVTLRDPSTSGGTKCLEPETDSSSSEAEEGEFLDEASIISFFDNEEGLLIEQLEKEYEDQERDQKRRLDDGLEGVASLLEMDGGEGDIRPSFFPMASIDGEVAFCKDKGTEHKSNEDVFREDSTAPDNIPTLPSVTQREVTDNINLVIPMEAPLENPHIVPNDEITMSNENQSLSCPVPSKEPPLEAASAIESHEGDILSSHLEISSPIIGPSTEENVTKATTLIERVMPDLDENRKVLLIKIFIMYPNMRNMHPDWKPCYIKYMFMSLGDLLVLMNSTTPMTLDEAAKREIELVINELERNYCD